jgi:hypothetical protein
MREGMPFLRAAAWLTTNFLRGLAGCATLTGIDRSKQSRIDLRAQSSSMVNALRVTAKYGQC